MKKSVVIITSYDGPYGGNFIASLKSLNERLKDKGLKTVYIFQDKVKNFSWMDTVNDFADKVYYLPYKPNSFDNIKKIKKILDMENAVLVYSRMSGWDIAAHLAKPSIPIIWHMEMNPNLNNKFKKLKYFFKYRIIGDKNVYSVAVSIPATNALNTLKLKNKCIPVENATDFNRLTLKKDKKQPFSTPVRLLTFGYNPYIKGLDLALDAVEILNKSDKNAVLKISAQELTYDYLKKRYGDSIPSYVELLEPVENISEIYDTADIILSPSRSEGFSFALLEGIYTGLPAVYSDTAGTSWADEMKSVYKFHSGNAEDMAEKIIKCINNGVLPSDREYNRELIESKYSLSVWSDKMIKLINSIIK